VIHTEKFTYVSKTLAPITNAFKPSLIREASLEINSLTLLKRQILNNLHKYFLKTFIYILSFRLNILIIALFRQKNALQKPSK